MKRSEKILRLRKGMGLSQEELAERLNVSRQAVSRWEVGSAQPDAENVFQMSRVFGVTADYLLDESLETLQPLSSGDRAGAAPKTEGTLLKSRLRGVAWGAVGVGALGQSVLYILSRVIEVMVPRVEIQNGQKLYTYSTGITARSYRYFIREYNLEGLSAVLWGLMLAGGVILLVRSGVFQRLKRRRGGEA